MILYDYVQTNYYFTHLRVFPTTISWWFSTRVWMANKSCQISRTFLSILVDLNDAVVCPFISKSSSTNPLVTVTSTPITNYHHHQIGIVTWNPIITFKSWISIWNTWNHGNVCKLLVLAMNTWYHMTVWQIKKCNYKRYCNEMLKI